jgi:hypothetical protein
LALSNDASVQENSKDLHGENFFHNHAALLLNLVVKGENKFKVFRRDFFVQSNMRKSFFQVVHGKVGALKESVLLRTLKPVVGIPFEHFCDLSYEVVGKQTFLELTGIDLTS